VYNWGGSIQAFRQRQEGVNMKQLVRLRKRSSRDGSSFKYFIDFIDENNKRRQISLGHADIKKAQRQRLEKEQQLRMGIIEPESMRLSSFLQDSIERTGGQVRESSIRETKMAMKGFIACVGNIDFLKIKHSHGERFVQYCLENGNAPATAAKKLRHLKRLFQLARERSQLEENPLRWVKQPKTAQKKVSIFTDQQIPFLVKAACQYEEEKPYLEWELLIRMALCTGMRRGELLNVTWRDIDFACMSVEVAPKEDSGDIWQWHIKDTDRRTLPLTDDVIALLTRLQVSQPAGCPYVFVPADRYEHVQELRRQGKWSVERGRCPLNNFTRMFKDILRIAGIKDRQFHDLRRTCLSMWLSSGLSEFEVMTLAGHSKFETTRKFYLAVSSDLVQRARIASVNSSKTGSVAHLLRTPIQAM
jgi:integrase